MDEEERHGEEAKKKRKDGWLDALFSIEALAVEKDAVERALAEHVDKLANTQGVLVYERNFYETKEVEKPLQNVEKAFSQVVSVKLLAKDLFTLINAAMLYGPSSVEILGPGKKEISVAEMQNIVNNVTGIVHQFASAGVGGIVISTEEKKK